MTTWGIPGLARKPYKTEIIGIAGKNRQIMSRRTGEIGRAAGHDEPGMTTGDDLPPRQAPPDLLAIACRIGSRWRRPPGLLAEAWSPSDTP
ncbi:hypothetical protein GCM10020219_060210 [Nonomuraea dietziae]